MESLRKKTHLLNEEGIEGLEDIEEENESPTHSPRHKKTKPKTSISDGFEICV